MKKPENLMGVLARGYCTKRNEKKVLDPDLIEDMAVEMRKHIKENYIRKDKLPSEKKLWDIIRSHVNLHPDGTVSIFDMKLANAIVKELK